VDLVPAYVQGMQHRAVNAVVPANQQAYHQVRVNQCIYSIQNKTRELVLPDLFPLTFNLYPITFNIKPIHISTLVTLVDPSDTLVDHSDTLVDPSGILVDPSDTLVDPSDTLIDRPQ
jgi:hypothetical protein